MLLYDEPNQTRTKEVNTMARKSTQLNREMFEKAVKEAEKDGKLKNLGALYDAIAQIYTMAVIALKQTTFCTPTLAKKWLDEWQIETLTEPGRKGRPAKESFLATKLVKLEEACKAIYETIPEEYQHLIADLVAIIDEKETTSETTEIEEETLPPILPEQTETTETEQTDEQRQAA